jgi:inner membrane protein
MPTILTHAAFPLAAGIAAGVKRIPGRLMAAGVIAAMLPDLDVIAFRLGVSYAAPFGHRGFSHSILFALILGILAGFAARGLRARRAVACGFVFTATLSHGLLDMLTTGGMGVALFWPFSEARFFAPWQVIEVAPLSLKRALGPRGIAVLQSELKWVWLPALAGGMGVATLRRVYALTFGGPARDGH